MPAIVIDVDDTPLATWNYELCSDWDYNPTANAGFVLGSCSRPRRAWSDGDRAADHGYAINYITGRPTPRTPRRSAT